MSHRAPRWKAMRKTSVAITALVAGLVVASSAAVGEPGAAASTVEVGLGVDVSERVALGVERAKSDPAYAGAYINGVGDSARVVFLFTSADAARDNAVLGLLPKGMQDSAEVRLVDHSMAELLFAKNSVSARMSPDTAIQGVGVDVMNNSLIILSQRSTEEVGTEVILASTNGIPWSVLEGDNHDSTCNDRLNCGGTSNRRAGVKIGNAGSLASSGLSVVKSGTRYSTTAGHFRYGVTTGVVTSGTQNFGSLNSFTYLHSGSFCDCRLLGAAYVSNLIYYSDADKAHAINSKRVNSLVGDSVRMTGYKNQSNGTVTYIDYDYVSSTCGCTIKSATLATYISESGDSGGGVTSTNGTIAVGIHSGRSGGYGRYFDVDNIQAQMGVTVLTVP